MATATCYISLDPGVYNFGVIIGFFRPDTLHFELLYHGTISSSHQVKTHLTASQAGAELFAHIYAKYLLHHPAVPHRLHLVVENQFNFPYTEVSAAVVSNFISREISLTRTLKVTELRAFSIARTTILAAYGYPRPRTFADKTSGKLRQEQKLYNVEALRKFFHFRFGLDSYTDHVTDALIQLFHVIKLEFGAFSIPARYVAENEQPITLSYYSGDADGPACAGRADAVPELRESVATELRHQQEGDQPGPTVHCMQGV